MKMPPQKSTKAFRRSSKAPRVLVIYKKSIVQLYVEEAKNKHVRRLIKENHPAVDRFVHAHRAHVESLEAARKALKQVGAQAEFRQRSENCDVDEFDLVVTLGGDGTLLWASHNVGKHKPVLAINTAPEDSVGFFCAGDKRHMHDILRDALAGRMRETQLNRMSVKLEGKVLSKRVLNEALFCHVCPAATARYVLDVGARVESQKSSGVWVGPAAGSTAAQRSAGGRVLPAESKDLQFVVRELYHGQRSLYKLRTGLVGPKGRIRIQSKIPDGRVFLDGPHRMVLVQLGAELTMQSSDEPLTLLGFRRKR